MPKAVEELVQRLINANVRRVYGVVGDSLNGIAGTIRRSEKSNWVEGRADEVVDLAATNFLAR